MKYKPGMILVAKKEHNSIHNIVTKIQLITANFNNHFFVKILETTPTCEGFKGKIESWFIGTIEHYEPQLKTDFISHNPKNVLRKILSDKRKNR